MADEEPTETEPLVQEEPKEEESPAADETAAGGAGESKDEKEDGDAEKGGEKEPSWACQFVLGEVSEMIERIASPAQDRLWTCR